MSALSLRHHDLTLAFLPVRRARRIEAAMRNIRLNVSKRRLKGLVRAAFALNR